MPDNLPTLHPRHEVVTRAHLRLSAVVLEMADDLTMAELFLVLSQEIWGLSKMAVKEDRHEGDDP